MQSYPVVSVIVVMLCVLATFSYLYPSKKKKKDNDKNQDQGKWTDFSDEYKDIMSAETKTELQYADPVLGRHLIYKDLDRSAIVNGKRIAGETVQVKFMMKSFLDGRQEIHAYTSCHYGKPQFFNGEVAQNYAITENHFVANAYDFKAVWKNVIEYYFDVKLTGERDSLKFS